MKAKELAEILLRNPDAEVTIQHQNYLQPIRNCVAYIATRLHNGELWVKPPQAGMQEQMAKAEVVLPKPEMVWALSNFLDRQFLGLTKEQAKDIGKGETKGSAT